MKNGPRRPPAKQARCCICSSAIEEKPAQLLVYWPEQDDPVALDAHASCLEQRTPLRRQISRPSVT
jgi:hypothetical protein